MVETKPDRDEREIEALQGSLHEAFDDQQSETGVDGALEALMGIDPGEAAPDTGDSSKERVHQCFLDNEVLGPDALVIRVAMADDPDNTVYFHAEEEEIAKVYGEIVDSGLLAACERRIERDVEP